MEEEINDMQELADLDKLEESPESLPEGLPGLDTPETQQMLEELEGTPDDGPEPDKGEKRSTRMSQQEYFDEIQGAGYDLRLCTLDDRVFAARPGQSLEPLSDRALAQMRAAHWTTCAAAGMSYNRGVYEDMVMSLAASRPWHPVSDYLLSLPAWDGRDHIGLLAACFPAALVESDGEGRKGKPVQQNARRILEAWLAGAVARGLGVDHQNFVLVLDGPTGAGKSYFAKWLCPPVLDTRFCEGYIVPDDKDTLLRYVTTWIWEIPELDKVTSKQDVAALKQFLTMRTVTVRRPYGRFDLVKSSLASFVGTVNGAGGYLVDLTGNRRFWPLKITGALGRSYSKIPIDQIWAQAYADFRSGKHLLTEADESSKRQAGEAARVRDQQITALEALVIKAEKPDAILPTEDVRQRLVALHAPADPRKTAQWVALRYKVESKMHRGAKGRRVRGFKGLALFEPKLPTDLPARKEK